MRRQAYLLFAAAWLASCGPERIAGGPGNGTETENVLTARVLLANGRPAAGVSARLRPIWWGPSPDSADPEGGAFRTVVVDGGGYLAIRGLPEGFYSLEVRQDSSSSVLVPVSVGRSNLDLGSAKMAATARLTGTIDLPAGTRRAWVRVRGLSGGCWTDSIGAFSLLVPQAALLPEAVVAGQAAVAGHPLLVAAAGADWNPVFGADQVTLEDFEDGDDTRNSWGPVTRGGRWWGANSGPKLIPQLAFPVMTPAMVVDPDPKRHRVLKLATRMGGDSATPIGFELDGKSGDPAARQFHDLGTLDSIVLWAKGNGKLGVKLTGAWEDSGIYFLASIKLDSVWKRYAIPADSQLGKGAWRPHAGLTQGIGFQLTGSSDVYLDGIALVGVKPEAIWPTQLVKPAP